MKKTGLYKFWKVMREARKKKFRPYIRNSDIRFKDANGNEYCPLTLCSKVLGDKNYDTYYWKEAATELDMDLCYAEDIVNAADGWNANETDNKIRKKLLKTLNLKETK